MKEKKAALCRQVLTFNNVFYLTFLELCCQVALNLQSSHALECSGTACFERNYRTKLGFMLLERCVLSFSISRQSEFLWTRC